MTGECRSDQLLERLIDLAHAKLFPSNPAPNLVESIQ